MCATPASAESEGPGFDSVRPPAFRAGGSPAGEFGAVPIAGSILPVLFIAARLTTGWGGGGGNNRRYTHLRHRGDWHRATVVGG